jgi:hypothetical protein
MAGTQKIQIAEPDWDMADWPPGEIVVEGIVMALEGCGDNEDQAAVIDDEGRELRILGVRRNGARVEIVVEVPGR